MNLSSYNSRTQEILVASKKLAVGLSHQSIEPEHLAASLMTNEDVRGILRRAGRSEDLARRMIDAQIGLVTPTTAKNVFLSPRILKVFATAETTLAKTGQKQVDAAQLMRALLTDSKIEALLKAVEITASLFEVVVVNSKGNGPDRSEVNLNKYATELTTRASQGLLTPVIGRTVEIAEVIKVLLSFSRNNALLVGKSGVGKSSIINALAQHIADGKVPEALRGCKVYSLDVASILAGATLRGQMEERVGLLLKELADAGNGAILFIDDADNIVGAGGEGASDISSQLKTALQNTQIRVIGTTSPDGLKRIEKDKALIRRFQTIAVEEPSAAECLEILRGIKVRQENHYDITISDEALSSAIKYTTRYFPEYHLPDGAINIIDMTAASVKADAGNFVSAEDISVWVSNKTGVPLNSMHQSEREKLLNMEKSLGKMVINQDEALAAISQAIRRSRAGLSNPNRPIGSFMFLGSSGCGKTLAAKALCRELFGNDTSFTRIDCAELKHESALSTLIGSAQGYKGSDAGGVLTNAVKNKPYSVVLLDEIEKSNIDAISDTFMAILDEGHLTSGLGEKIDFKNTVIIMTSNIGSMHLLEASLNGGIDDVAREKVRTALQARLKPEFLGRIDATIFFNSITRANLDAIAEIEFAKLYKMLDAKGLRLELTPEVKKIILDNGFDPKFGARSLNRSIMELLQNPLANALIESGFVPGAKIIGELNADNKIVFRKE